MKREEVFNLIYQHNIWGAPESRSGAGSSLAATEHIRRELPILFKDYGVKSILDIPCGDLNWMSTIISSDMRYIGADIVDELISNNQRKYPDIEFRVLDIVNSVLPEVDLILCRDCFFHFPLELIFQSLRNIKKSRSKYLLTTNFTWRARRNVDIPIAKFFGINLMLEPFNFKMPLEMIIEGNTEGEPHLGSQKDRSLCLWNIDDIPDI